MAVYAVGDVQGCRDALDCVLAQAGFNRNQDQLWLVGDIVNRGPQSLEVLRFVRSLGSRARMVLGNHEIHLLAVAEGVRPLRAGDTLTPILEAPDRDELLGWLRAQPLLHVDRHRGVAMVHAGIPPHWDLETAEQLAAEAHNFMQREGCAELVHPLPAEPLELAAARSAAERARVIVAYLTRMRVCTDTGRLNLDFKGSAEQAPEGYLPWFAHEHRRTQRIRILFGHWAALQGLADAPNVDALDTGCAWGRSLTLMRLEDRARFSCSCLNLRRASASESIPGPA